MLNITCALEIENVLTIIFTRKIMERSSCNNKTMHLLWNSIGRSTATSTDCHHSSLDQSIDHKDNNIMTYSCFGNWHSVISRFLQEIAPLFQLWNSKKMQLLATKHHQNLRKLEQHRIPPPVEGKKGPPRNWTPAKEYIIP